MLAQIPISRFFLSRSVSLVFFPDHQLGLNGQTNFGAIVFQGSFLYLISTKIWEGRPNESRSEPFCLFKQESQRINLRIIAFACALVLWRFTNLYCSSISQRNIQNCFFSPDFLNWIFLVEKYGKTGARP